MMIGFSIAQVPSEQILCHENVREDIRITRCTRMSGRTHHHVTRIVPRTSALPFAVRLRRTLRQTPQVADFICLERPHSQTPRRGAPKVTTGRPKDTLTLSAWTALHLTKVTSGCHNLGLFESRHLPNNRPLTRDFCSDQRLVSRHVTRNMTQELRTSSVENASGQCESDLGLRFLSTGIWAARLAHQGEAARLARIRSGSGVPQRP